MTRRRAVWPEVKPAENHSAACRREAFPTLVLPDLPLRYGHRVRMSVPPAAEEGAVRERLDRRPVTVMYTDTVEVGSRLAIGEALDLARLPRAVAV